MTRYWLACWFGIIFVMRLSALIPNAIGFDARLYLAASRAWLTGQDPWVSIGPQQYAAPPPTLIAVAPLTLLPGDLGVAVLVALCVLGAIATVRLLRLPWWWLLFPPLLDGVWSGNVQTLLVPLILLGAGPIAIFLKVYAIVPIALTLRWRSLAVLALTIVVTAPFLPWADYVGRMGALSDVLARQSDGGLSATVVPLLVPVALVALVFAGREKAAWLAVPALWPYTQWYYSTLAMPALAPERAALRVAAALLAVQIPGLVVAAAIVVALGERNWTVDRLARSWIPARFLPPDGVAAPAD